MSGRRCGLVCGLRCAVVRCVVDHVPAPISCLPVLTCPRGTSDVRRRGDGRAEATAAVQAVSEMLPTVFKLLSLILE